MPRTTRVFLSYARRDDFDPADPARPLDPERFDPDRSFVARLYRDLTAAGFEVWFDRVNMPSRNLTFHQEIRDAVTACDRLVLAIGPRAAGSDYVRQEWQFAWFAAEKIVTPILMRGRDPQPHADDIALLPDELKLLHCEDFRDPDQYTFHLQHLIQSLRAPAPPLGKLIGVPSLPSHFLSRADKLIPLCEAVRSGLDSPAPFGGTVMRAHMHGISVSQKYVGAHGMGGIGKTVLANLLIHDRKVREAFPDGLVWVGLGSAPNVLSLQQRLHRDLGGDGAFDDEHQGKTKLQERLADQAVLLVLDDAWRADDLKAFDVLGPRCRAIVTSRDAGLVTSLGGTQHLVELLTDDEALHLLAGILECEVAAFPVEARTVLGHCGRLPLAVSLVGGLIQERMPWSKLVAAFERHRLEFFQSDQRTGAHVNLLSTVEISVQALPPDEQLRLVELAVFPEDETVPEAAIATLWRHTGQLDDLDTTQLLHKLKQRSLIQIKSDETPGTTSLGRVSLHDVIRDYCLSRVEKQQGSETPLHRSLLDAYRSQCSDGWCTAPNDGYILTHLREHLVAAGCGDELANLMHELKWLEAKNGAGLAAC